MSPTGTTTGPVDPTPPGQGGGPEPAPELRPKVWIVGENNPYQADPVQAQRYALYFDPPQSAGGRLCRAILGMDEREYLRAFERRNLLCQPKWSVPAARASARALALELPYGPESAVVLLGRKVFEAFDWYSARVINRDWNGQWEPFRTLWYQATHYALLPHPSGRCRKWNAEAVKRARAAVLEVAPHLKGKLGVREGA